MSCNTWVLGAQLRTSGRADALTIWPSLQPESHVSYVHPGLCWHCSLVCFSLTMVHSLSLSLHRFKAHTLDPSNISVTPHQRASLHTFIACWGAHTSLWKAEEARETRSSWEGVPLDNKAGSLNRPSSWYIRMFGSGFGLQLLSTYWFREVTQWICP